MKTEQAEQKRRHVAEHEGRRALVGEAYCRSIGAFVYYRPDGDGFKVAVRVLETRNSYGTDHYLIEPLDGTGQRWTTGARLSPITEDTVPRSAWARTFGDPAPAR